MTTLDMAYIPSSLEGQRLHTLIWSGEKPRAVVQIVHGMAEHIARYDEFARFLCDNGFAVLGCSHLGHGLTAKNEKELGFIAKKDGWDHMVRDIDLVRKEGERRFPGLPYILLGHSMGSFLTRTYLTKPYAKGLAGAVISGTANQPGALVGAGSIVAAFNRFFCGKRHRSGLLNSMSFGSYNKAFAPNRTEYDWLSKNDASVDQYCADPFCGFCFTSKAFGDLFTGLKYIAKAENLAKMDKELPCMFIAGALDPVGSSGKGVEEAAEMFRKAGMKDVSLRLYDGDRHEVLNELDRQQVYDDVLAFFRKAAKLTDEPVEAAETAEAPAEAAEAPAEAAEAPEVIGETAVEA